MVMRVAAAAVGIVCAAAVLKFLLLDWSGEENTAESFDQHAWEDVVLKDRKELLPIQVNVATLARIPLRKTLAVAGAGFDAIEMGITSFQVMYADSFYVIDSGYDRQTHERMNNGSFFNEVAYAAVQDAMIRSTGILVTHEHPDHIGGILSSPRLDHFREKLILTHPQIFAKPTGRAASSGLPFDRLRSAAPRACNDVCRIAPGLLTIRAPGHSPGSRMLYVALQNGNRLLLVGDIVWHMDALRRGKGRPYLISRFMLGEDRAAVSGQISALRRMSGRQGLHIVPSHDLEELRMLEKSGILTEGFH